MGKLKIISDGRSCNTSIIDEETGCKITNVSNIEINIDACEGINACFKIIDPLLKIDIERKNIKIKPDISLETMCSRNKVYFKAPIDIQLGSIIYQDSDGMFYPWGLMDKKDRKFILSKIQDLRWYFKLKDRRVL